MSWELRQFRSPNLKTHSGAFRSALSLKSKIGTGFYEVQLTIGVFTVSVPR